MRVLNCILAVSVIALVDAVDDQTKESLIVVPSDGEGD